MSLEWGNVHAALFRAKRWSTRLPTHGLSGRRVGSPALKAAAARAAVRSACCRATIIVRDANLRFPSSLHEIFKPKPWESRVSANYLARASSVLSLRIMIAPVSLRDKDRG